MRRSGNKNDKKKENEEAKYEGRQETFSDA